jgi:hypothetical protein
MKEPSMSFGSFVTGAVLSGAAVYGSLTWHVLRTDGGLEFVPKSVAGSFAETYVDIRHFTTSDWTSRKTLSGDVVQAKKERLFQAAASRTIPTSPQSMASFGSWTPTQTR